VSDDELYRCGECGKTYREKCAVADRTIKELGVCSDSEELYEAEEYPPRSESDILNRHAIRLS